MTASFQELFESFCALDCKRFRFLVTFLEWKKIPFEILHHGGRHILVKVPGKKPFLKDHCRKILTAHYDRMPGTPGANDNSAAVFSLLKHISLLKEADFPHNTLILFTDKEELKAGDSVKDQGAWHLAGAWPREHRKGDLFIVLDMCGVGNTLIWGRTAAKLKGINLNRIQYLYDGLKDLLFRYSRQEDMNINSLFSDDLGLLLQGLTALQLSILPWEEAREWKEAILAQEDMDCPSLSGISGASRKGKDIFPPRLPPSWQNNHTMEDRMETLSPESFRLMENFLRDLARCQIPLPN